MLLPATLCTPPLSRVVLVKHAGAVMVELVLLTNLTMLVKQRIGLGIHISFPSLQALRILRVRVLGSKLSQVSTRSIPGG